ncbi:concanavalin A-like lectin/glucanase domain-containing protein [Sporodiniella umbellata]|nr:concanavalin A-like lectin/glucanase domain-containing protein [Sporodiniella umbellata]
MDYTVQSKAKNSLDRIFSPHNVKLTLQGLSLSVKKNQNKYTSASIGTKRSDFLYGTFRARMKTSQVPGTVAAFFYYHNVSSEIDMETLSRLTNPWQTYFAVQPQIYNKDGSASPLTHQKYGLGFDPTQGYHEYRFDWTPGIVKFFVDGVHVGEMTTHVPSTPGRIMVNHWTDGNPNFSGGPPENNTELVVSHLNLFFNSSESKEILVCQKRKAPCRVQDIMSNYIVPASHTSSAGILFPSCLICFSILFYLLFSIFVV